MDSNNPAMDGSDTAADLIGSDHVDGTNVYRANGDKIGHIERIMIGKWSGKAYYAVMKFGGFLGLGEDSYPLPWSLLTYNPRLEGFEVNVTEEQLKGAPRFVAGKSWDWAQPDNGKRLLSYYGMKSSGT